MAVTIRTVTEARDAGLVIPGFCAGEEPDEFLLAHDDDGDVVAWGPVWDRQELERLAEAY